METSHRFSKFRQIFATKLKRTSSAAASDARFTWTIRVGGGSAELARERVGADVTVTAPASDLLLLLWGRRSADDLEVDGEPAALQRFLARARF